MHAQSTQNNKFAISLQYLKKEGRHEVDILHAVNKPFYKLVLSILLSIINHAQVTQKMKLILVEINIRVFKKFILSYLMSEARHA